jgi:hypothetical protein
MVLKRIFLSFFFFLFLFTRTTFAKEKPQVVFINQVRGEECCSIGSLENLQIQVGTFEKYQIPSFFALRYDVLINKNYIDYLKKEIDKFPNIINLSLLIEITPQLAKDSGVQYHDTIDHWFEAQNVFAIGYKKEDRKKIIDHLLKTFKDQFGYYPSLTSAWLIDTDSLNYLHEKYGVVVDQITREQWGIDTYTLYGGPPHYPYPASHNWAFIPDFMNKNPLLIVRQTVTDPLYNYGETKKSYTSQPNDYMNAGLNFHYFKKLVNQALFEQKTTGFALLGLENTNELKYQEEYLKQIEYINELKDRIIFPNLKQLSDFWIQQKTTSYRGKDLINNSSIQAEFITTPDNRIRQIKSNGKTYTTDYRYYDAGLTDPYNDYVAKKYGFWIVPFALDYSHTYKLESIFPETKSDLTVNNQTELKINKIDPAFFNKTRLENYPYYLPEPIERDVDPNKSKVKADIGKTIVLEFLAKDKYGYPASISYPLEIETNPQIKSMEYQRDSAKHIFTIPNDKLNSLKVTLLANKKIVKEIWLFPRLLPFLKIYW